MQADLAAAFAEVETTYSEASEQLGYDLWDRVQSGPDEALNETTVTQPAMLTAGIAAWRCWTASGGANPAQMAGHSLGEYSALVVAGALDFADAVLLVRRRAELMQEAVPAGSGAMAAILGLDDEVVTRVCDAAAQGEVVSAVNFNSPGQVVIAGSAAAVERAAEGAKEAGARRALMLSVSVPSHCALMEPAAEKLAVDFATIDFKTPQIPVISNVDATVYKDADDIRDGLTRQMYSPVRWVDSVQFMLAAGASQIVECGPGKVLAGLTKRIERSLPAICIESPESITKAMS
jgi:[acyl-carrier-protein] S-malonyltransferase